MLLILQQALSQLLQWVSTSPSADVLKFFSSVTQGP